MSAPASLLGAVLALGSATCYGLSIVLARLVADAGVSGVSLVFYRTAIVLAGVVAIAFLAREAVRVPRERLAVVLVLCVSSIAIAIAYISAIVFVPVTVAVVVFYTYPVLIVLASPFVEGRRLSAALVAVAGTAFVGVGLVVGPAAEGLDWRGVALAGLASAAAATQFFAGARARDLSLTVKVLWINVATLPASLLVASAFGVMSPPADLLAAPVAVGASVVVFVGAFSLQFIALARTSAVAAGLSFSLEPVVAALAAALLLAERIGPVQIAGVVLVVAAIAGNVVMESARARRLRAQGA